MPAKCAKMSIRLCAAVNNRKLLNAIPIQKAIQDDFRSTFSSGCRIWLRRWRHFRNFAHRKSPHPSDANQKLNHCHGNPLKPTAHR